jgi:hypothetical protein
MFTKRNLYSLLLGGCLLAPVLTSGCGTRVGVGYRSYDSYHRDYHQWDNNESRYYNQWVIETRRPNREFRRLRRDEQRAYWTWRHRR